MFDFSGLNVFVTGNSGIDRDGIRSDIEKYGASVGFIESLDELPALVPKFEYGTIVLLMAPTLAGNDWIRNLIANGSEQLRFVIASADGDQSGELENANCRIIRRFPPQTLEVLRSIADLAVRRKPSIETAAAPGDGENAGAPEGEPASILLVEDNEINQRVISAQLIRLGYRVDIARNGREGLRLWHDRQYDLVLADCNMPVMNGFDMTAEMRKVENGSRRARTPVIAITGDALHGEIERCLAAGMDDHLIKPVELAELRKALRKWLPGKPPSRSSTSSRRSTARSGQ